MGQRPLDPDYLLAEEESAPRLSELFYFAEPHEYFSWRFGLLALAGDQTKDLDQFARDGISFGGFQIGRRPDTGAADDGEASALGRSASEDIEARRRYSFAVTEAAALLHHVSETLLRLYFAHYELPVAPWLEIARERDHARFKKRVRARFVNNMTDERGYSDVAKVFWGTADHSTLVPPIAEARFRAGVENIDTWMRYFARNFLDDAHLYNALKHGLAVNAGDSSMMIDDGSLLSAEGPSLLYLGTNKHEQRRVWSLITRWIDLGQTMGAIYVGIKLIETLWKISRLRYTGESYGPIEIYTGIPFDDFQNATVGSGSEAGIVITSMSMNLRYYLESEVEPAPDS